MKKFLLSLVIAGFCLPNFAKADGALIYPPDYYVYETDQKAAIFFENNQETLVVSTKFHGNTNDFSWILPTPSKPEVSKISKDFFTNTENLTLPDFGDRVIPMAPSINLGVAEDTAKVNIIEEKTIGYYDITILESSDKNALFDWFKENNYKYPEDGKYILNDYINMDWVFTAVKINKEAQTDSSISSQLTSGQIDPIMLKFSTDKMVFPMKISSIGKFADRNWDIIEEKWKVGSINNQGNISVNLYLISNHKKEISGFNISYANWIKKNEITKLGQDQSGNPWVNPKANKLFVTKVYDNLNYDDMQNDLFPINADDNKLVGAKSTWEKFIDNLFPVAIYVVYFSIVLFAVLAAVSLKIKSRVLWIFELVLTILTFIALAVLVSFLLTNDYNYLFSFGSPMTFFIYLSAFTIVVFMVVIIAYQKRALDNQ